MPDDIQVSDYAERVNRPGDFATLRQKNKDGMYNTLEQFVNDVYMVFQKAMSINSQDTVPYREAMSLLYQAKQVFLSLKSNQMYSESELTAWRQRHYLAKPNGKDNGNNGASGGAGPPTPQRPSAPARKKIAAKTAATATAYKSTTRQRGAKENNGPPGRRARKVVSAAAELGGAGEEQRRLAYVDEADHGRRLVPVVSQGQHAATLIYRPQTAGHTYQDSLRRFVRHAGLKARVAAEFRSLECDVRARQSTPAPAYYRPNAFASSSGTATGRFLPHGYRKPPSPPSAAFRTPPPLATADQAAPRCRLETDEVLKLLALMGRPAFMERARILLGHKREESGSKEEGHEKPVIRAGDEKAGVTAAKPGKKGNASEPAIRVTAAKKAGKKGSASEPAAVKFEPFAPPS